MFNQHAKWLDACRDIPWRRPISSLNYLLIEPCLASGTQWLQPPGSGLHRCRAEQEGRHRPRLPAAGCQHAALRDRPRAATWNRINIIVAGKPPSWQWLSMDKAIVHCRSGHRHLGLGVQPSRAASRMSSWPAPATCRHSKRWRPSDPREHVPDLKISVVNVVDLMTLQPKEFHPHGLSDRDFDALFTTDKPVIFAYHGYPWTIHRLTYRRTNHANIHVRGYNEEGTTTTPFDMTVLNGLDRFHLVQSVIDSMPGRQDGESRIEDADARQADRTSRLYSRAWRGHAGDPSTGNGRKPARSEMSNATLVLNAGSSSLKFAVFEQAAGVAPADAGQCFIARQRTPLEGLECAGRAGDG